MAAEALLSSFISLLVEKSIPYILQQFRGMGGVGKDLEKLQPMLLRIQSVLNDAEERQVRDNAVKIWLDELKDAAYDAKDVLDEFHVEILRRKAQQGHSMNKVRELLSSHNPVFFQFKMWKKLTRVLQRIDSIVTEMNKFKFVEDRQPQTMGRPPTHSYVVEEDVVGRKADREEIVRSVLEHDCSENVMVVSIVGMGGLGKTTLAQMVYNDSRVVKHFQPLMWVCVSDDFDIPKLTRAVIGSATGEQCVISDMELLQRRVREVLSEKKYLLVLDDVWNEQPEKWDGLKALLWFGAVGSRIMVTTRSERVSLTMGTQALHRLPVLSEEDAWMLFKRRAFPVGREERPELLRIGKEIVRKCRGVPLAAKALGGLMLFKTEEREWSSVMQSELCDIETGEDGILPALRLSYRQLPSYLKRCFAFCAIFPKDHVIEKDLLIQLWMANGFIPKEEKTELEVKGHEIFNELVWRSFLQDVKTVKTEQAFCWSVEQHGYRNTTTCKMHDLMHDLAQAITGNECFIVPSSSNSGQLVKGIRHLSIIPPNSWKDIRSIFTSSTLHTILLPDRQSWGISIEADTSRQKFLRVIHAPSTRPSLSEKYFRVLPENLKHLRYLDLSRRPIETLPEAITTLFCLQTLKLTGCYALRKLPEGMRRMSGLRHLHLGGCDRLQQMPAGMGQLSSLQTLTKFIVGTDPGRGLVELKNLNLRGSLQLCNLKNVREAGDSREANLGSKHNLHSLELSWNDGTIEGLHVEGDEDSEEVLEALKPHRDIKVLAVDGYGGVQLPIWMRGSLLLQNLQNLIEIYLSCTRCKDLPPLGQLPLLKVVHLRGMDAVKHIGGSTSYSSRNDGAHAFPSLKKLKLNGMWNLEAWWAREGREADPPACPRLVELEIFGCPKLTTMPQLPSLESLELREFNQMLLGSFLGLTSLTTLRIYNCTSQPTTSGGTEAPLLVAPGKGMFGHMESLETLVIDGCEELAQLLEDEEETRGLKGSLVKLEIHNCNRLFPYSPLGLWKNLSSLRTLSIEKCDALVSWPEEFRCLTSLKSLNIWNCRNLDGASSPSSVGGLLPHLEDLRLWGCDGLIELPKFPASLRSLQIENCTNLRTLPEWLGCLTQLSSLEISGCHSITSLPQEVGRLASLAKLKISGCEDLGSLPDGMEGLTALQRLQISWCPRLKSLPVGLQQRLPHLVTLEIDHCPDLERRCKEGGKYWHLVVNIPDRIIRLNSTRSKSIISTLLPCLPTATDSE